MSIEETLRFQALKVNRHGAPLDKKIPPGRGDGLAFDALGCQLELLRLANSAARWGSIPMAVRIWVCSSSRAPSSSPSRT